MKWKELKPKAKVVVNSRNGTIVSRCRTFNGKKASLHIVTVAFDDAEELENFDNYDEDFPNIQLR